MKGSQREILRIKRICESLKYDYTTIGVVEGKCLRAWGKAVRGPQSVGRNSVGFERALERVWRVSGAGRRL